MREYLTVSCRGEHCVVLSERTTSSRDVGLHAETDHRVRLVIHTNPLSHSRNRTDKPFSNLTERNKATKTDHLVFLAGVNLWYMVRGYSDISQFRMVLLYTSNFHLYFTCWKVSRIKIMIFRLQIITVQGDQASIVNRR